MRCPSCEKLYSIEESWVRSAPLNTSGAFVTPLRFECVSCKTRFEAKRPSPVGVVLLDTLEIPVSPQVEPSRAPQREVNREPVARAPLVTRSQTSVAKLKCPKCGTKTNVGATECRSCGVVFARYKGPLEGEAGEIRLEGHREIAELWDAILANYEDMNLHDRFVLACHASNNLAYASQKYARILSASSHEDIARKMRKRVIALASYKTEIASGSFVREFRVPKFNNLVLVLGGGTMTFGLVLPDANNLTGIGIASIALAIGLRIFLRPSAR